MVLVIGATGTVGREVVRQLHARDVPVRALVRKTGAGLPVSVELAQGDLGEPDSIPLDGIESVFLLWTVRVDPAPVLDRILGRVKRVVFLSSPFDVQHPYFQNPQPNAVSKLHASIERRIQESGVEWTFLKPGIFSSNAKFWWGPQIRSGSVIEWPLLEGETAPIDERDKAAVAVHALCDDGHAGKKYAITGSQALTMRQQIETIGRVIDKQIEVREISAEEARERLLPVFQSAPLIDMLMRAWQGAMEAPAFLTSTVEEVTGVQARSFEDWARDNADEFLD